MPWRRSKLWWRSRAMTSQRKTVFVRARIRRSRSIACCSTSGPRPRSTLTRKPTGDVERGARRNLEAISLRPANRLSAQRARRLRARGGRIHPGRLRGGGGRTHRRGRMRKSPARSPREVLIIEDEPLIALDLREVVEELGHSVVGVARTHAEALAEIAKTQAWPHSRGHSARRRKLGARGRQRDLGTL